MKFCYCEFMPCIWNVCTVSQTTKSNQLLNRSTSSTSTEIVHKHQNGQEYTCNIESVTNQFYKDDTVSKLRVRLALFVSAFNFYVASLAE